MRAVVEDSVAAAGQLFTAKDVVLDVSLPERVPAVRGDRDRLVRVLINLLSNAAKFVEAGAGRVGVSSRATRARCACA
ncbi:MAG: hypothetical protein U1F54_15515 [Burkholderiales bacterium]